uniref:GTP-binding protein n=1 Tax=Steinernema glaseri TaxID=37863 RepID=A0A1I8A5U0_9BILA
MAGIPLTGGFNSDEDENCYDYGPESDSEEELTRRPKIVIMGQRRSGKTSIKKVVFQKMSPNETLFCESTSRITSESVRNSFIKFETIEFPGQIDPFDPALGPKKVFTNCGAMLYVIDAQDEVEEAMRTMITYISRAYGAYGFNKEIRFECFIHKVDGLSEETKMDTFRSIFQHVKDELDDLGAGGAKLAYHMTSIYDHSIFDAFSKVVQKLIVQLPTLEKLLDIFNQGSNVEKSFLFDMSSKIFIATDSTPVDMATYELCCDMIDVTLDISSIYGSKDGQPVFDSNSSASISLRTNQALFLRQVNKYLALVSIVRSENVEKPGLMDYNFGIFKSGVERVFRVSNRKALQKQKDRSLVMPTPPQSSDASN